MWADRWTKAACSFLFQCKGTGDPTIVDKVARWIDALGYRKVVLKTDGEPALVAVQEAVARARTHETMCKNPPGSAMASRLGYTAGFSMDLTTSDENGLPWDLSLADTQRRALRR